MSVELTKHRFDVDDYHRMAEAGILGEDDRVELTSGDATAITLEESAFTSGSLRVTSYARPGKQLLQSK